MCYKLHTYFALSINLKSRYMCVCVCILCVCVHTDRLKNKLTVNDIVCFRTKN